MTNTLGTVGKGGYVLLTTFRKDGTPVSAPMWAVFDDSKLYVWTATDSWKVKRLRNNPALTVQTCDPSGKRTRGDIVEGIGHVLDADGTERVRKLLKRKYWLLGPVIVMGSILRRGKSGTVGIEITPV
ncbi:PPOX class F420-dependent oxidoreductase [Nocardia brasiliensis]|uniref:PPOX class F420-dependent oxidoreductase n=1 Tax=Nocardia brasiliensis TaxID=37326 RepID=UPI003670038C